MANNNILMDTILSTFRPGDASNNGFMSQSGSDLENVHRDAKHMICMYLVEPIREMFDHMYRSVLHKGGTLKDFQRALQAIPRWNMNVLDEHCNAVRTRCEGLSDIVSALFLERIKVLSVLRVSHDDSPVSIKIPSETRFCHRVFEKCAEEFYRDPWLFKRHNDRAKTQIILSAIDSTVQRLLPIKDVLAIYMKAPMQQPEDKHMNLDGDGHHHHQEEKHNSGGGTDMDGAAKLSSAHNVNVTKLDAGEVPEHGYEKAPGSPEKQGQYFEKKDFADDHEPWNHQHRPDSPGPPAALDIGYPQLVGAGHDGHREHEEPRAYPQDRFLFDAGNDNDLDDLAGE